MAFFGSGFEIVRRLTSLVVGVHTQKSEEARGFRGLQRPCRAESFSMQDCAAVLDCFSPAEDETDSMPLTDHHPGPAVAESDAPHGTNREGDSQDNPDLADDATRTVDDIEIAAAAVINRHHRHFFCVMTAVSIGGIGVASFAVLAGGKVGTFLPLNVSETMVFGAIGIAVDLNVAQQADPATNVLSVPNLQKRARYWLAIGILMGLTRSLQAISLETKHEGTMWQPEPLLYQLISSFVGRIVLVGGVVMRAHRDRRPTVTKWYAFYVTINALSLCGKFTPYPLISFWGEKVEMLMATVGLYVLVTKIDKDTTYSPMYRMATSYSSGSSGLED